MARFASALALLVLLLAPALAQPELPRAGTLPEPVVAPASAVLNGSVYLFGGRSGISAGTAAIVRYDPDEQRATRVGTLPADPVSSPDGAREAAVAFALGGRIYVAGGAARVGSAGAASDVRALRDIIEFDPATNVPRTTLDVLPNARFGSAAAVVGSKAYIIGGYSAEGPSFFDDVLVFDPAAPEGSRVTRHPVLFPAAIRDARAVAIDDAVLVLGGLHRSANGAWSCGISISLCPSANLARFDPASGATTVVGQLWTPMTLVEAGRIGDAVHIVGGTGGAVGNTVNVTRLDLATWESMNTTAIANATGGAAVEVVGGTLYRFGGKLASSSAPRDDVRLYYGDVEPPGAPLALAARPEGNATRLAWLDPQLATNTSLTFRVTRESEEGTAVVYEGPARTALDNATRNGTVRYRVEAFNGTRPGPAAEVHVVAGVEPAPGLEGARAYSAGGRAAMTWRAPANATNVSVERDGIRVALLPPSAASYLDTALGTAYVVRAVVNGTDGLPGDVVAPTPLLAPTGLALVLRPSAERSSFVAALSWNGTGDESFDVLSGPASHTLAAPRRANGTQLEVPRVVPGTTTWFAVRRVEGELAGPLSAPVAARAASLPPAPSWLEANDSARSVLLTWEHVAPPNATYTLWRVGGDGVERVLASELTVAQHTDAALEPNILYTYFVTTEAELRSARSPTVTAAFGDAPEETPPSATPMPPPPAATPPSPVSPSPTPPPSSPVTPSPHVDPSPPTPSEPREQPAPGLLAALAASLLAVVLARRRR